MCTLFMGTIRTVRWGLPVAAHRSIVYQLAGFKTLPCQKLHAMHMAREHKTCAGT
jgi:hypothetical protein